MIVFETKKFIESQDIDDLVQMTYGKPYSFQQQDGCQSKGIHHITVPAYADDYETDTITEEINGEEMGVSFKAWLARDPKEWNGDPTEERFLYLYWQRNFYPDLQTVVNDLHTKGLFPAGEYVINIDW